MENPEPDYNLGIAGGSYAQMTARMLVGIEEILQKEKPDGLLVYGDTNSTLAAGLAAVKLRIPVLHVEAGNRLGTLDNPEEINRITTDHVATLNFCATEDALGKLQNERLGIAGIYKAYETVVVSKLDAVVAATSHIAETFQNRANKVIVINNYPKLDDVVFQTKAFCYRSKVIANAGGLSEVRGEKVLVNAMQYVQGTLTIANDHPVSMEGNINYIGKKDRAGVNELYSDSRVGIVIYQPADNHYDSQPIKMFEFMAAGLPVVASNFPLWKRIVKDNKCGICVNPCDYKEVAKACNELLDSPTMAEEMGKNGRKAEENKYSWMSEERKLIDLYHQLESKMER